MKPRNLAFAIGIALAGCHHEHARTTPAPQPDYKNMTPHAMAARVPASPGSRKIEPASWVFFETDSDKLTVSAQQDLDAAAAWLIAHPGEHIVIAGHADVRGGEDYNMQLSFRRGIQVADYLASRGVPRSRISLDPEGKQGAEAPAKQADRRAVIYTTGERTGVR